MSIETDSQTEEGQIRQLLNAWTQAVKDKDIDAVMAFYASDIVAFDVIPPLRYVGAEAYRKNWQMGFDMCQAGGSFEMHELQIAANGNVAYSHRLNRMQGTSAEGEAFDCWVRWTACFQKIDGTWLITHEHISSPIDMESGKGLMDLQP